LLKDAPEPADEGPGRFEIGAAKHRASRLST